jgi:hypothetical protein
MILIPGCFPGYVGCMGLIRNAAVIGIAKVIYDQARKPENQARLRSALAQVRSNRGGNRGAARERHS